MSDKPDILIMQGVLEHLDDPFGELQWMIDHLKPRTVITSSPCFLNPRGIVWMTLDMLGAVMSKTDLHYLNPWQFREFADRNNYRFARKSCEYGWAYGEKMIEDMTKRIPLSLSDGGIAYQEEKLTAFLAWLKKAGKYMDFKRSNGAVIVYRYDMPEL